MPLKMDEKVLAWGPELIETNTVLQAAKASRLPFVEGHLALMPDAHIGKGSTVGSVIPTKGAIIPAAIGVDIGCGMAAIQFDLKQEDLPDLHGFMPLVEKAIPAGVGKGRDDYRDTVHVKNKIGLPSLAALTPKLNQKIISQCGTLGSGNHFFEVCVDQDGLVWMVLHSGSRYIGKEIAEKHIAQARGNMRQRFIHLEDPDLAYLVEGEDDFQAYISDMLWAQDYARLNRETMLDAVEQAFITYLDSHGISALKMLQRVNCHHNFTQREHHNGKNLWITRKGAIKAAVGDLGIIPGSMGTSTFIVRGLGNQASYNSCSHGAGRVYSRSKAKQNYSEADLIARMGDRVWNGDRARSLVDEIPDAYKQIEDVMEAQKDLVEVTHTLNQIFNYKG
jgi:tRNA-splicing ligase RtcB (3'-phosphate/5'-hydroxy nucleic acid ligase)